MNRRTDKLIGLNIKEINSIGIINKLKTTEIPLGKKLLKKRKPCLFIAIICIPQKSIKLRDKVRISWLVRVYVKGIKPNKLLKSINVNKDPKIGKYFPLLLKEVF